MILPRCFFALLGIIALQSTGTADFLDDNDKQSCIDLCESCEGTATLDNDCCECHVADDNQRGAECIYRMKRRAAELGLDVVSCDLANPEADRPARCITSPFRRFRSREDAELIAKYFMGHGLGGLGSLLGSSKLQNEGESKPQEPYSSHAAENVGAESPSSSSISDTESAAIVGAPNTFGGANEISGQSVGMNPLLGAAAAWLHPNTLLAMRNGMQGFVGQPLDHGSMSSPMYQNHAMDSSRANFDSMTDSTNDLNSAHSVGAIVGTPYPYIVGTPYLVQSHDGVQVLSPIQSYSYSYNSMAGAENPSFDGSSSLHNYPTLLGGANDPQNSDSAATAEEVSASEIIREEEAKVGAPNPQASLVATGNTDSGNQAEELVSADGKNTEAVVGSVQSADNSEKDAENAEETKVPAFKALKQNIRQRVSKFRSKESAAKSEPTIKKLVDAQ